MEEILNEEDFLSFKNDLLNSDKKEQGFTVAFMAKDTVADTRLVPYLEKLLGDKTFIQLCIPLTYCEMRYAAAYALANIYYACGFNKTIELKRIAIPLPLDSANGFEIDYSIPEEYTSQIKN